MDVTIDKDLLTSFLTLATVIEARDRYTGGHTWRVSEYARLLGEAYGVGAHEAFVLQIGGLVHDVGKIGIPDSILNKPGPLDDTEYTVMKEHPVIGLEVIEKHPLAPVILSAVTQHHERIDGKGYPKNAGKDDFFIFGKIVSVADAFDAMTSTRPYRKGIDSAKALGILEAEKGKQFDAKLVDLFINLGEQGKLNHILGHSSEERLMLTCPQCGPIVSLANDLGDGSDVTCPCCTGNFKVHQSGVSFELEFTGSIKGYYVPAPDLDVVNGVVGKAVRTIHL